MSTVSKGKRTTENIIIKLMQGVIKDSNIKDLSFHIVLY